MLRAEFEVEEEVIQKEISESKLPTRNCCRPRQMVRTGNGPLCLQEGGERAGRRKG